MREYELTVIIQPEISEEGSAAILERVDGILAAGDGIRLLWDDLGKRKLAYEINKFHKGHYYIFSFLDGGEAVPQIERLLRLDESVLRFLTIKVSEMVLDIEGRKAEAKAREVENQKRAAEKAAREAEEASAREQAERQAAEQAQREAAEQAAAAAAAEVEGGGEDASEESDGDAAVADDEAVTAAAGDSAEESGSDGAEAAPEASADQDEEEKS